MSTNTGTGRVRAPDFLVRLAFSLVGLALSAALWSRLDTELAAILAYAG